ncbi:MAG: menaquinone-dependent protoporphyrinogen IX dehydrogenase [Steroidobacteraceae bacterium]|nr:menaquinone-dependent protoporphyrinogen IX dehydrogenase [Steroidobacteraceae bacterium]
MAILLLHQGVYGQTRRICEFLRNELAALGVAADVAALADPPDPSRYDAIAIGASIRNGKHNPAVLEFVRRHRALFDAKPNAFFSVNLVARKPEKNTVATNPYLKAFLDRSPWQPTRVAVFAGNLDYRRYGAMDRNIIRFIMWITKGPTDPHTKIEYTNWDEVRRFAGELAQLGAPGAKAVVGAAVPRAVPAVPAHAA